MTVMLASHTLTRVCNMMLHLSRPAFAKTFPWQFLAFFCHCWAAAGVATSLGLEVSCPLWRKTWVWSVLFGLWKTLWGLLMNHIESLGAILSWIWTFCSLHITMMTMWPKTIFQWGWSFVLLTRVFLFRSLFSCVCTWNQQCDLTSQCFTLLRGESATVVVMFEKHWLQWLHDKGNADCSPVCLFEWQKLELADFGSSIASFDGAHATQFLSACRIVNCQLNVWDIVWTQKHLSFVLF